MLPVAIAFFLAKKFMKNVTSGITNILTVNPGYSFKPVTSKEVENA